MASPNFLSCVYLEASGGNNAPIMKMRYTAKIANSGTSIIVTNPVFFHLTKPSLTRILSYKIALIDT